MKPDLHQLFSAAVKRMDDRYDPISYRSPVSEVSLRMRMWQHERWQVLFREWQRAMAEREAK